MTDKQIVLCTTGSEAEAHKIARHLVEQRLAACVNIVPKIESIYRWQEKVESSQEWLLLIKTTVERFPAVRDAIRQLHSYELPECIAISIEDGSAAYLQWIDQSTTLRAFTARTPNLNCRGRAALQRRVAAAKNRAAFRAGRPRRDRAGSAANSPTRMVDHRPQPVPSTQT